MIIDLAALGDIGDHNCNPSSAFEIKPRCAYFKQTLVSLGFTILTQKLLKLIFCRARLCLCLSLTQSVLQTEIQFLSAEQKSSLLETNGRLFAVKHPVKICLDTIIR